MAHKVFRGSTERPERTCWQIRTVAVVCPRAKQLEGPKSRLAPLQDQCGEGARRQADLSAAVAAWVRPQQRAAFSSWLVAARAAAETRAVVATIIRRWQSLALSDVIRSWQVGIIESCVHALALSRARSSCRSGSSTWSLRLTHKPPVPYEYCIISMYHLIRVVQCIS